MTMDEPGTDKSPQISLKQVWLHPEAGKRLWRIGWHVENPGCHPVQLKAVRFPHGQFKSDEQRFTPAFRLGHGEGVEFEANIACDAEPGAIVENAFIIFSATWLDQPWRIFVRLRVSVNEKGEPAALTELVTAQQVGFSAAMGSTNRYRDDSGAQNR